MKRTYYIFFCFFATICLLTACKKEHGKPRWDVAVVTPIIKTTIGVGDFLFDSAYTTHADNSVSLVHRQLLYSFGLDSLIGLKVKPFYRKKGIESLNLATDTLVYKITLGDLARQMKADGNPAGDLILSNHGNYFIVPSTSGLSVGPFIINISTLLHSAEIKSGEMTIVVQNDFPVDLKNIDLELRNNVGNDLILSQHVNSIPKHTKSDTLRQDLAGKHVEGVLKINIPNMDIGGGYVKIDTSAAITATILVKNLTVQSATAIFPQQNIIEDEQNTPLDEMRDIKLTKAILKSGNLHVSVTSTAQDSIFFNYAIPVASKNGVPFIVTGAIPPSSGSPTVLDYDISGYEINLTGKNKDTINAIYNKISAWIKYTGQVVSFSLADYIEISLSFNNVKPSYIEGFLGQDTIAIDPTETDLSIFEKFKADQLSFKEVNLSLEVENGLGIKGDFAIDYLSAANSGNSKTILNPVSGTIPSATKNPLKPSFSTFGVNSTNPAPVDLLNLLPNKVGFQGKVYLNKGVSNTDLSGFAYDNSTLNAYLSMELPLNLEAKNLTLSDTVKMPSTTLKAPLTTGIFNVLVWNGFPFNASLAITFFDENGTAVDSLVSSSSILAAPLDPTTLKVSDTKYSKVSFEMNIDRLQRILNTQKALVQIFLSSQPENKPVQIYSDYTMNITLAGDFNYTIKSK